MSPNITRLLSNKLRLSSKSILFLGLGQVGKSTMTLELKPISQSKLAVKFQKTALVDSRPLMKAKLPTLARSRPKRAAIGNLQFLVLSFAEIDSNYRLEYSDTYSEYSSLRKEQNRLLEQI